MEKSRKQTWRCSGYGRRLRSNLEMQRLREKIKIEPGDAAATGKDEEEGYGKRQQQAEKMERRRWNFRVCFFGWCKY
ncbi:hypothetical protein DVH24_025373 [Malus domestica]|uniref:Uncharacterized protein n=1 Tax=Malus domestica TaxID=3750 RepID=A0A498HPN3_MALDO|nr:hypothetical protein DVH24_025373 [Malus domestica]